jgi:hypothetical protein
MKRILYSLCIGSVILALTASGASAARHDSKKKGHGKTSAQVVSPRKGKTAVRGGGRARVQHSVARPHSSSRATVHRSSVRTDRGRTIRRPTVTTKAHVTRDVAKRSTGRAGRDVTVSRERALRGTGDHVRARREVAGTRDRSFATNRAERLERSRNVKITNNWRDRRFSGTKYAAFRDYRRSYHNRDWYRHNYSRVIFVSGGWWYWNLGYWYPAWGYAPYAYYPYDGPIYTGYADLTPDQVIINVQIQLERDGYYVGAIDGILGPITRRALAAFQEDSGLAVTSTIDQPTLSVLGVS